MNYSTVHIFLYNIFFLKKNTYCKASFSRHIEATQSYTVVQRVLTYVFRFPPSISFKSMASFNHDPAIFEFLKNFVRILQHFTRYLTYVIFTISELIKLMQ